MSVRLTSHLSSYMYIGIVFWLNVHWLERVPLVTLTVLGSGQPGSAVSDSIPPPDSLASMDISRTELANTQVHQHLLVKKTR